MKTKILISSFFFSVFWLVSCKKETDIILQKAEIAQNEVTHAKGFSLRHYHNFTLLRVTKPWPEAKEAFTYVLAKDVKNVPDSLKSAIFIKIPLQKIVVTSTTHLPSLVNLQEEKSLIGFPGLDYISSPKIRAIIHKGMIKELRDNDNVNVEMTIDLQPQLIVGHSMEANNPKYTNLQKAGVPVIFNGDWVETTPLGKAEWIKFFGALYDKNAEATAYFKEIEKAYTEAKMLVKNEEVTPAVLSGAMYQDVWYAPQGESWMAQFVKDANGTYVWNDTKGTGSLSLSLEDVIEKAQQADYWIGPAQFTSYVELENANKHYTQFKAFKERKIYTYSAKKGEKGGVVFYEEAPNRPDLILKDLIFILHPQKLPGYTPYFIEPLQ